jgi:hypothetical protein
MYSAWSRLNDGLGTSSDKHRGRGKKWTAYCPTVAHKRSWLRRAPFFVWWRDARPTLEGVSLDDEQTSNFEDLRFRDCASRCFWQQPWQQNKGSRIIVHCKTYQRTVQPPLLISKACFSWNVSSKITSKIWNFDERQRDCILCFSFSSCARGFPQAHHRLPLTTIRHPTVLIESRIAKRTRLPFSHAL